MAARRPPRPRLELTGHEVVEISLILIRDLRESMKHVERCREEIGKLGPLDWMFTPEEQAAREQGVARARLRLLKLLKYGRDIGYLLKPPADQLAQWMAEQDASDKRAYRALDLVSGR
jgi:hypothetical protein